jgi:CRP-like cAMP-binding protein
MSLEFLDRRSFGSGQIIFREGQPGNHAYIVQRGTVELSRAGVPFAQLHENAIFGEMALIDGEPRMATAAAKDEVVVIVLPKSLVDKRLEGIDPFVSRLLHILVANVRSIADQIM